jgi:hypothetical protein
LKQSVLPSAEKLTQASPWSGPVSQINPGAKTSAVEPGGVCPRYGPLANGSANAWRHPTQARITIQYRLFHVGFIDRLLLAVENDRIHLFGSSREEKTVSEKMD